MSLKVLYGGADFSDSRTWRYRLWRRWDRERPYLTVIGLNPSTADEEHDDPTVRRCMGFAEDWGFGGLQMLNLFALRATDPRALRLAVGLDQFGRDNWLVIQQRSQEAVWSGGAVLAAWGNHGGYLNASVRLRALLESALVDVACLGRTMDGEPKHPLYLPRDTEPIAYIGNGGRLCVDRA